MNVRRRGEVALRCMLKGQYTKRRGIFVERVLIEGYPGNLEVGFPDSKQRERLVAVVIRFVRTFRRNAKILGLLRSQSGELHSDLFQMEPGYFLVQFLGKCVDADLVDVAILPEVD